jgi:hypothetical protein
MPRELLRGELVLCARILLHGDAGSGLLHSGRAGGGDAGQRACRDACRGSGRAGEPAGGCRTARARSACARACSG